jgi:hypothetical protein
MYQMVNAKLDGFAPASCAEMSYCLETARMRLVYACCHELWL